MEEEGERERDRKKGGKERGKKGEESTATEKVEGREKAQLSPDCSPVHPAREDPQSGD